MKLYYMNDERKDMVVRVMDDRYNPATATGDTFTTLKPCELREFDVQIPEGAILYIKKWPNIVMLSFYDLQNTCQSEPESLQEQQDQEP